MLSFEEAEETKIKLPTFFGSWRKQGNSKQTSSDSLITLKPLTVWITTNWKILTEMGIPGHFTWLLRNLNAGQDATIRTRHGTMDWFQIEKGVCQGVYCHLAYLISMQSTSCKMPDSMKHNLESRFQGEISITSNTQMTPPFWQKEELKSLLMKMRKVKEESKNVGLKLNIQKIKIMESGPITL